LTVKSFLEFLAEVLNAMVNRDVSKENLIRNNSFLLIKTYKGSKDAIFSLKIFTTIIYIRQFYN
jgi:hypothetical protein